MRRLPGDRFSHSGDINELLIEFSSVDIHPWTAFPSAWTSKGLEDSEAIRHGPQAWASPRSLHLLSASPLKFQALLMLMHCPNSPQSVLCRVKRDKNVGCAERCPGRWAPHVRSRLDPVDAHVLTLSHFPGSLAIFCAVAVFPRDARFVKRAIV